MESSLQRKDLESDLPASFPLPATFRFVLVLLTPLFMVLSFPDFEVSILGWIALTPLWYVLTTTPVSLKTSFLYGTLAGSVFFYGSSYWITYPMIHYGGIPAGLAYLLACIPAVVLGVFWGFATLGIRWCVIQMGVFGLVFAPALWAFFEWDRYQFTGMGWNALGYSQAFHPWVIQIARQTGVYGVGFLLAGTAAVLAGWLASRFNRHLPPPAVPSHQTAKMCVWLVLLSIVFWLALMPQEPSAQIAPSAHQLHVVAIQPDIPIEALFDPNVHDQSVTRLLLLTEKELANQPDLVIWPESPLNFSPTRRPETWERIVTLVRRYRVPLLLNMVGESPPNQYHNSLALIAPDGRIMFRYDKVRLLPFGEYVPLRGILPFVDQIPALAGDFIPGQHYPVTELVNMRMGSFICSESVMPEIARRLAQQWATLLIEVSNDSWFGPTPGARQHLAHSVFRAVENECHLVRVTNSGITAHITPDGQVHDPTELFQIETRRWVMNDVIKRNGRTFYTRRGDLFILVCVVWSLAGLGLASLHWWRLDTPATSKRLPGE